MDGGVFSSQGRQDKEFCLLFFEDFRSFIFVFVLIFCFQKTFPYLSGFNFYFLCRMISSSVCSDKMSVPSENNNRNVRNNQKHRKY